ncbi:unnamed protein product [Didymodactylos carnosus]|uniref:Reverse transcriptase domain-containing protein n=1 Tax=Didymodactylos carnosus TaxID=1234261 RepID=A0A814W987_9BILA|nr:unnamed protein product [Didymodactylos carnosus]CAF1300525.1 unnamed protein product [Didymodactylos carnosus]CAF3963951.1 unnamed protein product [Didymodactylos carnosus]CAF4106622.1 unnamed protein product [Didymodactylos carnosus]
MTSSAIDHNSSQLTILSANARKRILFSTELLNSFVNQHYYDFLIVSEYHDDAATTVKNDHLCMTKRCVKRQGGVLVCFKNSLNITRAFECETDQNDIIDLFAHTKPKITCFIAVYNRPGRQNVIKFIDKMYKKIKKHTDEIILIGDLNARHQHWGDHVNNTAGKKLYEKIIEYDLEIANEFRVSTYFDSQGSSSIIDLTLHTEELLLFSPKWSVGKQQLNQTDHELIEINLHDLERKKSTFQSFQDMCRWNYSRADWTKFVQNIDDAIGATGLEAALIRNKDEIDKFAKQIDDILLNAAHVTIPKENRSPQNYNRYLEERKRFETDIETAKSGYWSKISKSMKLRTIQTKMSRKPQQPIPDLIDENNKQLVEKHEIVQEFIDEFCTDNNSGQDLNTNFGFRKGLGTEDAQLFLAHQIAKGVDKNQVISAAFLDVGKAFNSIDPNLLFTKLKDSGISSAFVSFIRSFCGPRQAYISIENDITSKVKLSSYGIPQGSSLSPVLFNIYIRSIFRTSSNNTILFGYADDLTVTVSGKKSRYNVMRLRSFISKIENSLREIKLEIQIDKTHLIYFNRKRQRQNSHLIYKGSRILPSDPINYLGVIFDKKFKRDKHLEQISISIAREFGKIKRWISQNKLQDVKTLIDLYKTRLISKIDYGAPVSSATLAKSSLKRIEKIQKQYLSYAIDSFEISPQVIEAECRILPLRLHLKMKRLKKAASVRSKGLFNPL